MSGDVTWCPKCHLTDQIAKVSGLRESRLAPPERPEYKKPIESEGYLLLASYGAAMCLAFMMLTSRDSSGNTGNGACLIPIILWIALGLVLLPSTLKKQAARRAVWEGSVLAVWKSRYEKWNRLYYCRRDDIVFDPDDGTSAPASNLREYIFM